MFTLAAKESCMSPTSGPTFSAAYIDAGDLAKPERARVRLSAKTFQTFSFPPQSEQ